MSSQLQICESIRKVIPQIKFRSSARWCQCVASFITNYKQLQFDRGYNLSIQNRLPQNSNIIMLNIILINLTNRLSAFVPRDRPIFLYWIHTKITKNLRWQVSQVLIPGTGKGLKFCYILVGRGRLLFLVTKYVS